MNRRDRRAKQQKTKKDTRKIQQQLRGHQLSGVELIAAGDKLLQARKWAEAAESYQQALDDDDNLTAAKKSVLYERIGYAYSSMGKIRRALPALHQAITLTPDRASPHKNIAALYKSIKQPEQALTHLAHAAKTLHDDADLHYLTAECHRLLKDRKAALGEYAKAINLYGSQNQDAYRLTKLGRSLVYCGQNKAAEDCLETARRLNPKMPGPYLELASLYEKSGAPQKAIHAYRQALAIVPQHPSALSHLAGLMARQGRLSKAAWSYRRLHHLFPTDLATKHLLAAVSEKGSPEIADENYVRDLFDDYADRFDDHLVNGLGYQTPQLLQQLLMPHMPDDGTWDILDLGCGTGLCGPLVKPAAKTLTGIDLSQGMLDKAAARDIYDNLLLCDAVAALEDEYQSLDLCLSADVFVYIGDLSSIFDACHQALRPDGLFAFSVEKTTGDSFHLDISGRYQHSDRYIKGLAERYGFTVLSQSDAVLRHEYKQPVSGTLYLLSSGKVDPGT